MFDQISLDFCKGAFTVTAVIFLPKLFALIRYPSIERVHSVANEKVPQRGDNGRITIWGINEGTSYKSYNNGIPDQSSFTSRVVCFLRLHKLDYVKEATNMFAESPRNMVPVANVFGLMVDDSPNIIRAIKKHYGIPDPVLTTEQQALGHMVQVLMTRSFPRVLKYMIFLTERGRYLFWEQMKNGIPAIVRPFVKAMIFRDQYRMLKLQGIAIQREEELYAECKKDLQSLADTLGDKRFILGTDEATDADVDVYVWVGHLFYNEMFTDQAWPVEMKAKFPTLLAYTGRMRKLLFPGLDC